MRVSRCRAASAFASERPERTRRVRPGGKQLNRPAAQQLSRRRGPARRRVTAAGSGRAAPGFALDPLRKRRPCGARSSRRGNEAKNWACSGVSSGTIAAGGIQRPGGGRCFGGLRGRGRRHFRPSPAARSFRSSSERSCSFASASSASSGMASCGPPMSPPGGPPSPFPA